jgi:hypothetical protein
LTELCAGAGYQRSNHLKKTYDDIFEKARKAGCFVHTNKAAIISITQHSQALVN